MGCVYIIQSWYHFQHAQGPSSNSSSEREKICQLKEARCKRPHAIPFNVNIQNRQVHSDKKEYSSDG